MVRDEIPLPGERLTSPVPDSDAHLLAELHGGDVAAGRRFVQEYYPALYRYLLYLTGHRETAEDLTQETFVQAWRHLDQFQGRAPVRVWLHTIARHEFLRARRRQRDVTALEAGAELAEPHSDAWTEEAELRVLLGKLPEEQQEVMLLSCLAGYSSGEIAQILQVPARTVRHRLALARAHLAQALGPGDLAYLNEPSIPMRQWAWLPLDQMHALETRLVMRAPGDRAALEHGATTEEAMERREFLRQAAVGAAGLMLPDADKEVIDRRLTQKVTLAFKGTALSDVCEHLRAETGVHLAAGASVADEKVTLFCEKLPLRDVMRQLSRPFGYAWTRSTRNGAYRYELMQDLRSQLLEEELRNRDRNAALLALEREIERYRPYLALSPDEALARAKRAPENEKHLLEKYAGVGWGPIQMYFRLSPQELAALRAGQTLAFSQEPDPGERQLPADLARGVIQCNREWRLIRHEESFDGVTDHNDPKALPLTEVPEVRAQVLIEMAQSELGEFSLHGASGAFARRPTDRLRFQAYIGAGPYAVGRKQARSQEGYGSATASDARDPALQTPVTLRPQPSCAPPAPVAASAAMSGAPPEPKVTTADLLEALHRATGLPIVADFYTRLYKPEEVSVRQQALFAALNHLSETMRLRWSRDGEWLQFRSASYYHDRLKEVPNRLLSRWAETRRRHGMLPLDDLVEIAGLSDAQLDAEEMRQGAVECWGLQEWPLLRTRGFRGHVRFLAEFTPAQRQAMQSPAGLPFIQMSLPQQQGFISRVVNSEPLREISELAGATLRVDYTQPGWFQWQQPGGFDPSRWVVRVEPGRLTGRRVLMPPVRERTREAALAAARRAFPAVTEAMLASWRESDPEIEAAQIVPQASQIFPTELDLVIVYIPGDALERTIRVARTTQDLRLIR